METEFYDPKVTFSDPLTTLTGVEKYEDNVDLLAGRTPLGAFLFKDASILLHGVEDTGNHALFRLAVALVYSSCPLWATRGGFNQGRGGCGRGGPSR